MKSAYEGYSFKISENVNRKKVTFICLFGRKITQQINQVETNPLNAQVKA